MIFLFAFILLTGLNGCNLLRQDKAAEEPVTVCFIDVGQGDASLILTPERKAFLIDTGNDSAEIINILSVNNLDTLHAVLLTHADLDHYGAFKAILGKFFVKRVILPEDSSEFVEWGELLSVLQKKDLVKDTLFFGDTLQLNSRISLKVLWPIRSSRFTGNNQSYLFQLVYGQSRVLFTGDIEEEAEIEISKIKVDIASQILKVSHHGSQTSSSLPFLAEILPDWAVISCDSTVYGHPHDQTVNGLKVILGREQGILRTDRLGDIEFKIFPDRVEYVESLSIN